MNTQTTSLTGIFRSAVDCIIALDVTSSVSVLIYSSPKLFRSIGISAVEVNDRLEITEVKKAPDGKYWLTLGSEIKIKA